MSNAPTTSTELRNRLCKSFDQLDNGEINVKIASELSNMVGKITSTVKMQLEYAKLRKEKPTIPFLK